MQGLTVEKIFPLKRHLTYDVLVSNTASLTIVA